MRKVSFGYSKSKKMLICSEPESSFVPGYLWYLCESFKREKGMEVEKVYFTKENEEVLVSALKGVKDWDLLYENFDGGNNGKES